MRSAPITGDEYFRPLLFPRPTVRVREFWPLPRAKVRIEKPVWGSQGVLSPLSLALERKGAVGDIMIVLICFLDLKK